MFETRPFVARLDLQFIFSLFIVDIGFTLFSDRLLANVRSTFSR